MPERATAWTSGAAPLFPIPADSRHPAGLCRAPAHRRIRAGFRRSDRRGRRRPCWPAASVTGRRRSPDSRGASAPFALPRSRRPVRSPGRPPAASIIHLDTAACSSHNRGGYAVKPIPPGVGYSQGRYEQCVGVVRRSRRNSAPWDSPKRASCGGRLKQAGHCSCRRMPSSPPWRPRRGCADLQRRRTGRQAVLRRRGSDPPGGAFGSRSWEPSRRGACRTGPGCWLV